MSRLELFVIGFGRPDLLTEQKRLLDAHLQDEYGLCCLDNTKTRSGREDMEHACRISGVGYMAVSSQTHEHVDGLNLAAKVAKEIKAEFWGVLDHDVFPAQSTFLIHKIKQAGFYGMGNGLPDGSVKWLWPGFCFFSRDWLNGRVPDFTGVKGGDAGSGLHVLFSKDDWAALPTFDHGYEEIRPPDAYGRNRVAYGEAG